MTLTTKPLTDADRERIAEYLDLKRRGNTIPQAAHVMGMTKSALEALLTRGRRAGIPALVGQGRRPVGSNDLASDLASNRNTPEQIEKARRNLGWLIADPQALATVLDALGLQERNDVEGGEQP